MSSSSTTRTLRLFRQTAPGNFQLTQEMSQNSPSGAGRLVPADLDRDGRRDIFLAYPGRPYIGYLPQLEYGLANEVRFPVPSANQRALAVGDINHDGCNDVAVADPVNGLKLLYGKACRPRASGDIDGDGKADLIWRDNSRNYFASWRIQGPAPVSGTSLAISPAWRVLAAGDFSGTGLQNLIWTDGASLQMWTSTGAGYVGVSMRSYPAGWRVIAVGDTNCDGKADLLWRDDANTTVGLCVLDGPAIVNSASFAVGSAWRVAGSGDLNGDG